MLFSIDDEHSIRVLQIGKQYTVCELLREFPNKKWFRGCLSHVRKKSTNLFVLNALPVVVDHGHRVMLKTSSLFVHSQEDRPHSHCSVRQIAREAHITRSSVQCT